MKNTSELRVEPYLRYKSFLKECANTSYESNVVLHKHHIIPKCLGGSNKKENLVKLSVEDHIKAHLLLAECFDEGSKEQISNLRSARILNKNSIRDQSIIDKISESYRGDKNPFYGKKHSEENIKKIVERNKKRKNISYDDFYGKDSLQQKKIRSDSTKEQWSNRTDEERKTISEKISNSLTGNIPWNKGLGTRVKINGISFNSLTEAEKYFQMSKFLLRKNYEIIKE